MWVLRMASNQHQAMVGSLISYFQSIGLNIICAAYEGYNQCSPEGRHQPDVKAKDSASGLISIGEVKTADDLNSDHTKEQLVDFSSRVMTSGQSAGKVVPFYLLVPEAAVGDAWRAIRELGLSEKSNIKVLKA